MADRMEEHMKEMPVFTAVGAGHLPGQKGIIQLLRNKGYSVTPVEQPSQVWPQSLKKRLRKMYG